MSKFIGIVKYQKGDKVKYITPSSMSLQITKVDTTAELTVSNVEIVDRNGLYYQICEVTDGRAKTFATGLELMPAKEDEYKMWEANKAKINDRSNKGKRSVKATKEKFKPNIDIASNALNGLNLKNTI
jgi:hypothetical protein